MIPSRFAPSVPFTGCMFNNGSVQAVKSQWDGSLRPTPTGYSLATFQPSWHPLVVDTGSHGDFHHRHPYERHPPLSNQTRFGGSDRSDPVSGQRKDLLTL
ncbi:hypothetical protein PAXRUDRAFT_734268 [Paxillus rubicundulus Ve08.2h10]|uniref:Uncharacterized protein n=1 Tax=Paxillus rubicundulus Ve08.2h10 TaxID=930991 RepID=A0A0D0DR39_9AGAM|nr:hypothetical protein PAXRUDRAFT_734268 [Paxillus rubicundulus Ve08.2h10]